jgi:hypothetical protein
MINHARTLLLNKNRNLRPAYGDLGEEYIEEGFSPVELTAPLTKIREVLLGSYGDPLYENYRLAQYMSLLHAHPTLRQVIKEQDTRVTYDWHSWRFSQVKQAVTVTATTSTSLELTILGQPVADEVAGQLSFSYILGTGAGPTVDVNNVKARNRKNHNLTIVDQTTNVFGIGTELSGRFMVPGNAWEVNTVWHVQAVCSPKAGTADILHQLRTAAGPETARVMEQQDITLRDLWRSGHGIPDLMGSALVGYLREVQKLYVR